MNNALTIIDLIRLGLGAVALLIGTFIVVMGALGLLRLRDVYERMHAAGLIDTGGAGMILFGLLMLSSDWSVSVRLLLIGTLLVMTSPTATHAIARAARYDRVQPPQTKNQQKNQQEAKNR